MCQTRCCRESLGRCKKLLNMFHSRFCLSFCHVFFSQACGGIIAGLVWKLSHWPSNVYHCQCSLILSSVKLHHLERNNQFGISLVMIPGHWSRENGSRGQCLLNRFKGKMPPLWGAGRKCLGGNDLWEPQPRCSHAPTGPSCLVVAGSTSFWRHYPESWQLLTVARPSYYRPGSD